jgi:hypothetical protein
MSGTQLELSDAVTITAPTAGLTIDGNQLSRVFQIDGIVNVALSGLTIINGYSDSGGGIYNGGTLTLTNCTVSTNFATQQAGGILNGGTLQLNGCTLAGNQSTYYGGLFNFGSATLVDSTIYGNSAILSGGGLGNSIGAATLINCTVSKNVANTIHFIGYGGGIALVDFGDGSGTVTLANTIVADNYSFQVDNRDDISGAVTANYCLIGVTSGANITGSHNIVDVANSLVGPLANNGGPTQTCALLPGSPAINAGSNGVVSDAKLTTDQTGAPRTISTSADIGAVEVPVSYFESLLREQFGFHFAGGYSQSYGGLNAKWFQDRSGNWFALFADGTLKSWQFVSGKDNFSTVNKLDASAYSDPEWFFQAPVTLSVDATANLTQSEQARGFHFVTSYYQNYLGLNEKWFQDRTGVWFVLTTDGQVRPWLGGTKLGSAAATVDPLAWDNPDLLFEGTLSRTAQAQLSQLRHDYGFVFTGNYSQAYGGLNAKWFQDRAGNWFALFADGTLKSWQFVTGRDNFTLVAPLDPAVYTDPQLLFQAPQIVSAQVLDALHQTQLENGFHFVNSYYQNYLGQNEKWFQDSSGKWFVLTTDGRVRQWQGGTSLGNAVATLDPVAWDDPTLLFAS